jgi:Mrp family chromosome partitioning ATPase
MAEVLTEYATQFRFILLDSPPLAVTSDTIALASMVDGVVVVAGAATPKQTVRAVCRRLGNVGAEILGVVLNGVEAHQTRLMGGVSSYAS